VFHDFHTLYPDRITNVTNGITFRRWLFEANPGLTQCLVDVIGPEVMDNAMALKKLEAHANDTVLHERLRLIRRGNKAELGRVISQTIGVKVDPDALFDVQIKRMHEYKRQLLNILETVALYEAMRAQPHLNWQPRVKIFAGKAAASYHRAKQIIKLIHDVAKVVNNDPSLRGALKVAFLPNYNVSLAQKIIPASDLSEQISTAGMEASGTGNMKLSLNGALTIGTLDGANVEIRDHVGDENIFIFGLTTEEVDESRAAGINAQAAIAASPNLKGVLDAIRSGVYSPDEPTRYHDLVDAITYHDHFLVCADFDSYYNRQRDVAECWSNPQDFWRKSVINTANMGWFSSDRSITDYGERVWELNRKPHHQA
jgi:starch phosphorylase